MCQQWHPKRRPTTQYQKLWKIAPLAIFPHNRGFLPDFHDSRVPKAKGHGDRYKSRGHPIEIEAGLFSTLFDFDGAGKTQGDFFCQLLLSPPKVTKWTKMAYIAARFLSSGNILDLSLSAH